jgi:hypothetical protein
VRWISLPAIAAALALALPALAARPPKNATYTGTTSQRHALSARVTSDGKGLQLDFYEKLRCNRGRPKGTDAVYHKQRPTIRRDGTFSYFATYRDMAPVPGLHERYTERQRITGSFSADGKSVRGRVAESATGRSGLHCKAKLTFEARIAPTP